MNKQNEFVNILDNALKAGAEVLEILKKENAEKEAAINAFKNIDNGLIFPVPPEFIPVVAKQDNDGHWYVIPAEMQEEFSRMLKICIVEGPEWENKFIEKFGQYMTGGDLNLTQLYMKDETQTGSPSVTSPELNSVEYHPVFTLKKPGALEMVEEFHQAFGVPVYITPSLPTYNGAYSETLENKFNDISNYLRSYFIRDSRTLLRMKLIFEEYKELCEAMRDGDFVKILDGLCDLLYVTYGTAHEFGLGPVLKEAFREVHRSNMSKLGADGKPVYREDGKVLKGPNFTPPDLARIITKGATATPDLNFKEWDYSEWRDALDKAIAEGKADKINIPEITPIDTIQANIEFKPTTTDTDILVREEKLQPMNSARKVTVKMPDDYERQVTEEQPPTDDSY